MSVGEVMTAREMRKGALRNGVAANTPTYACVCGGIARPFRARWETNDEILYKCRKCFALYFSVGELTQNRIRTARADKNSAVRKATLEILGRIHDGNPDELSTAGSVHRRLMETGLRVSKVMVDGVLGDLVEAGQVTKFAFLGRTGYRLK